MTTPTVNRNEIRPRKAGRSSRSKVILWLMIACNASLALFFLRNHHHQYHYGSGDGDDDDDDDDDDDGNNINPLIKIKSTTPTTPTSTATTNSQGKKTTTTTTSDPYALARTESFGFFYDITEEHWKLYQKIFMEHENHRYPDLPWTYNPEAGKEETHPDIWKNRDSEWSGWHSYAAWYQNNYEPNFSCPFEKRVGEPMNGDGPKWVCDPHRITKLAKARKAQDPTHPGCVVYSIGSNGDFSFELGLQNEVGKGVCEFHIFDPGNFEHEKPKELKRAFYDRWGIEKETTTRGASWLGVGETYRGLIESVKLLGHEDLDVIDVFKIDCEKCEWRTYKDWLSDKIPLLHQIQVEVHNAPTAKEAGAISFFDSFEEAGYLRFHKEPNIQWGSSCIEYAFVKVKKAFMRGKNSA